MKKADIGLVGLAVMGENLVMNMVESRQASWRGHSEHPPRRRIRRSQRTAVPCSPRTWCAGWCRGSGNRTELDSYLIEITRDILGYQDEKGETVVEHILDTAGQKGTGKWTGIAALDEGVPLTLIGEAVFAMPP